MTEHQIALARRAVAAPGWRWMRGMRITGTKFARVVAVRDGAPCGAKEGATCDDNAAVWLDEWTTPMLPDLSDPLTALGLLALVRERWGPDVYLVHVKAYNGRDRRWTLARGTSPTLLVGMNADGVLCYVSAETEAEALILALEATP